jgi:hypothetical protein
MNQDNFFDQTKFAEEAVVEKQPLPEPTAESTPTKKKYLALIVLTFLMAFLVVVSVLIVWLSGKSEPIIPTDDLSTESSSTSMSPIQRQLYVLQKDIEKSDPFDASISFPPVDFGIDLEDAAQRALNQR